MKAIELRQLVLPLLLGGTLFAASLPALADRDHRRYDPPRTEQRNYRHDRKDHDHFQRGKPHHQVHKHYYRPAHGVVHKYYYPPRAYYSYQPGVVVSLPPIVIKLN